MVDTKDNTGHLTPPGSTDEADEDLSGVLDRLRLVLRAHWRSVWRLLRRLGVDVSELEEATAQVFLLSAAELDAVHADEVHAGEGPAENARRSLYRTAVGVAGDAQSPAADGQRRLGSLSSLPPPSLSLADSMTERRGLRQLLDRILGRMPFDVRAPFVLCDIEGLDVSEAAALLEASEAETSSRRTLGREVFRAEVARVGAADPVAPAPSSDGDTESLEWSPFERNVIRSAELDEAPDELEEGIETALEFGMSAEEEAALDQPNDDRAAAMFGQVPPYDRPGELGGEDALEAALQTAPPPRKRVARVVAAVATSSLGAVIAILASRSCSSPTPPVAETPSGTRDRAPAEQHVPPAAAPSNDAPTLVEPEMRLEASDGEPAAQGSPAIPQRSTVPDGVLPAPGDPSYQWWIARFPLLEEDWKLLPGAGAASGRDPALYSAYAGNEGLKDEVGRLDAARMLLENSRATDAMQSLDAYRDRWPSGALSVEAMVLRVRTLLALDRLAEAEQQTQVLESVAPNSQHARNARALVKAHATSRRK